MRSSSLLPMLWPLAAAPCAGSAVQQSGAEPRTASETPRDVVAFEARLSHPLVLAGEPQDVHLHLSLTAAELPSVPRLAMNLALVIDRSGSMGSEDKLLRAKEAAEQIVGRLRPDDRLTIVAYDTEVETLVPSTPASEETLFRSAIRGLTPGDSTNLCGGLLRGCEEVASHMDAARLNRVVLLSDGLANAGVTDPEAIRGSAMEFRERGLRISTMGMGISYDERLMSGIAQHAGGNYYYVDHAEAVGRHLDRELDELGRIVARDLEARVVLGEGVELQEVHGHPWSMEERTLVVRVEDLYGGQHKKVVIRLRVRGAAGTEQALATAVLRHADALSNEARGGEGSPLRVRFTDDAAEVERARNVEVLIQVEVVRNAQAMEKAMALQKKEQFDGAQSLLAARYLNCKTLNEAEYHSQELTRMLSTMRQLLLDMERTRLDASARRDLQLCTELMALGYAGD